MTTNLDGSRTLNPLVVHFGPQNTELQIADGASALGYIFSIVDPPPDVSLTWSEYFMPLLVLFSKCLYLLFGIDHDIRKRTVSGAPVMANVMYLHDDSDLGKELAPFFYGATLPAVPLISGTDQLFKTARGMLSTWRRDQLLIPALQGCERSRTGSPQSIPLRDPNLMPNLIKRLDGLIRGAPQPESHEVSQLPLFTNLDEISIKSTQTVLKRAAPGSEKVLFDQLLFDSYTKGALKKLLETVIQLTYGNPTIDRIQQ